ncbi:hypothetical protein [Sphingobium sp. Leaf26]|uniref:hypothetical protein n=1 Tax=Sphingobium sp. Leaf26 TaxID=1735693 RepID=UPI0012E2B100|nr:hypothetical protein [Sphingobium sp. Leaf26]
MIISLAGCNQKNPTIMKIGEATYQFSGDVAAQDEKSLRYVIIRIGDTSTDHIARSSFTLEYDQWTNSEKMEGGFPNVRGVSNFPKLRNLRVIDRPWGRVVCNRLELKDDSNDLCGTTFLEFGAVWQVKFKFDKLKENRDIVSEARLVLRKFRI